MSTMAHKGYMARVAYSDEDALFTGRIAGIDDVIGFHGKSVAELKDAFVEVVEDYFAACQKIGRKPH